MNYTLAILGPAIFGVLLVLIPIMIAAIVLVYLTYLGVLFCAIAIPLFIIFFASKKKIRKRFLITPSILMFVGVILMIPFFIVGGKSMLNSYGERIDEIESNGAIHYYIMEGNLSQVKRCVEAGEDIEGIGDRPPLIQAVTGDNYDIARYLIESGANINATDDDGETALHFAVCFLSSFNNKDQYEFVKYLIANGADIDAQDNDGVTPLMEIFSASTISIDIHTYEFAKLLVDSGADTAIADENGRTALDYVYSCEPKEDDFDYSEESMELFNKLVDMMD